MRKVSVVKLPKPLGEMSDAELDAWALEQARAIHDKVIPPA